MNLPRTFIIGDLHGCIKTFEELLCKIGLTPDDNLYFLGDYIDRGPASKEVIDKILDLRITNNVTSLIGNHEYLMLEAFKSAKNLDLWLQNGAAATLESFGTFSLQSIDNKYKDFLNSLKYYVELDNFILVHGGFNFSSPFPFNDIQAMLWSRSNHVDFEITKGKRLIVGHTPTKLEDIRESLNRDVIKLDGGCVHKQHFLLGYLAALELNSMELYFQKCLD